MMPEDIILKPVLTEKAMDGIANKTQIKTAVEQMFGVKVAGVNTVTRRGKLKRMGRNEGYTPTTKKAVITLKEDSKPIEVFNSLM